MVLGVIYTAVYEALSFLTRFTFFVFGKAPTYMAEMSPSRIRGAVVSAKETIIVFGIVVGMLAGDFFSDYPDHWTRKYCFFFSFFWNKTKDICRCF